MANRLRQLLRGSLNRKLLVPFFTAGYPDLRASLEMAQVAGDAGADIIELGMPFSDPLADGPAIQYSSQIALGKGISLRKILKGVESIRSRIDLPVVLMGYYNPILAFGPAEFARRAASAGVDGFIIPDLPVEEATDFRKELVRNDLSAIFLVAPTSSAERVRLIDRSSTDLVYAVTVTGVTGARRKFDSSTDKYLMELKQKLRKKFVAGFGVSSAATARKLARYADGVVIGSALVEILRSSRNQPEGRRKVGRFLSEIRKAI